MSSMPKQNRAWLLATAKTVAKALKLRRAGTRLRIRIPRAATSTNTDGWSAIIGDLGRGQPRLEVWFDRFAGYPERKLFACFRSEGRLAMMTVTKRVDRKLWPARVVTSDDFDDDKFVVLKQRVGRLEFNAPFLEKYREGRTFYGVYDPTRASAQTVSPYFCLRAVAFFEDVARSLPRSKPEDDQRDVYPQCENRKKVFSHLHRERSKLLAAECKIRDNYKCQVCAHRFEEDYGRIGREFAEAHHVVPLSKLRESVKTRLEDLATVCSNCHRMLHRMAGKRADIGKLKALTRMQRSRKKKRARRLRSITHDSAVDGRNHLSKIGRSTARGHYA
jgi:5-methylcytosine-specific restriction endonuclease McrA